MSVQPITIEVDGIQMEARKGAMLIEVTDAAGIHIPRFCYHKKLTVAANCRMCLVEVEKAPKPLPACATPVMDGMKVWTQSAKALSAQQGTMEFLLINHPLDCPICDQGGECELQDVAMGYGSDVSRFVERKRVVKDKDIGPLIATEMTRCIHCTRCVRFGTEIAGIRELGATGRGEHMEIGTYLAKSIVSELSGNVVDICPVGALTAKPSRFAGRSWEYAQHPAIAPHDSIGSHIFLHTMRDKVMRVVPRDCESINETWISDRDRFSYEGLYSLDRAVQPLLKQADEWQTVEWDNALTAVHQGLSQVIEQHGPDAVGILVSPTATLEELYLAQKLSRGLGINNIDHRLRQADFSDQGKAPVFPWLGQPLETLEQVDAALLIGSNVRMEQPIAGHRLRKAALAGGKIMFINPRDFEFRFPVAAKMIVDPLTMVSGLAGVAKAIAEQKGEQLPDHLHTLLNDSEPDNDACTMADNLINCERATVLLGNLAVAHPLFSRLRALAVFIAESSGASLGYLPEAANSVGAWLTGVLPHRTVGGKPADSVGLDARAMLETPRKAYVLAGFEPAFDCWDPATATAAIQQADFVVALSPYASDNLKDVAQVILPVAAFSETSGTYVNAEGCWQSFQAAVKPRGMARPAWKVWRVLGNAFALPGFEYMDSQEILEEIRSQCETVEPRNLVPGADHFEDLTDAGPMRLVEVPIYSIDPLVRRARSLQKTPLAGTAETAALGPAIGSIEVSHEAIG
ncbi:MAG: NADH-quinone oxidoreductase subunit NuoG [Candidatus Competibacteraceae bacterium]|jgi:NADH-quinone oxidoreductase subunit G|nr:NADH-quinone oxidoreductase subunit NuoG [Candidatus Competibacteraceae bacterium]